jgi:RIMS-binding protein 2
MMGRGPQPNQQNMNQQNPNQPYYGGQMGTTMTGQQNRNQMQGPGQPGQRGPLTQQQMQQQGKKARLFMALFDYDPSTMSPNPDGCEEELPFQEGDHIKVRF